MFINFHSIISIYNILQLFSHETVARIEPTISEVKGATGPLKCYTRHGKNYRGRGAKQSRGGGVPPAPKNNEMRIRKRCDMDFHACLNIYII